MNNSFYFSHDYSTRVDNKIKRLIAKHGYYGYGIFWAIVEDLYQNANALRTDYDCIAFDLRANSETIKSIVEDFELFEIKDGFFGSLSVQRRVEMMEQKSQKARESAMKRWNKNANALRSQCEGNAIKEKKRKEKKESNNTLSQSLFDNLDEETMLKIAKRYKVKIDVVASYKEKYILWINEKPNDKNRWGRSMSVSVANWIRKDLESGNLKYLKDL